MKITAINGYHLALPQAPTTLCRGVEDYSGHLYRDISEKDACKPSPIMTYLVEVQTDAGMARWQVLTAHEARCAWREKI